MCGLDLRQGCGRVARWHAGISKMLALKWKPFCDTAATLIARSEPRPDEITRRLLFLGIRIALASMRFIADGARKRLIGLI
jgi:hypothetical protein